MTALGPESVPAVRLHQKVRRVNGRLLLGTEAGGVELSASATFLWSRIDNTRTIRDLGELMVAEYGIDLDTAVIDLIEILDRLRDLGVVHFGEGRGDGSPARISVHEDTRGAITRTGTNATVPPGTGRVPGAAPDPRTS